MLPVYFILFDGCVVPIIEDGAGMADPATVPIGMEHLYTSCSRYIQSQEDTCESLSRF